MVAADTKDVELCYPAMYFTALLDLMDNFQRYTLALLNLKMAHKRMLTKSQHK